MEDVHLTVETTPSSVLVEESGDGRRVEFSFVIENGGPDDLLLYAIDQDVYDATGGLIQQRSACVSVRLGGGERRTICNPLPEFGQEIPLTALVYTFAFRGSDDKLVRRTIGVLPIQPAGRTQCPAPNEQPALDDQTSAPTPRQLAQAWFETLYALGVYTHPGAEAR